MFIANYAYNFMNEHKHSYFFKYIKMKLKKIVKSIIERITTKDNNTLTDDDLEEGIIFRRK